MSSWNSWKAAAQFCLVSLTNLMLFLHHSNGRESCRTSPERQSGHMKHHQKSSKIIRPQRLKDPSCCCETGDDRQHWTPKRLPSSSPETHRYKCRVSLDVTGHLARLPVTSPGLTLDIPQGVHHRALLQFDSGFVQEHGVEPIF